MWSDIRKRLGGLAGNVVADVIAALVLAGVIALFAILAKVSGNPIFWIVVLALFALGAFLFAAVIYARYGRRSSSRSTGLISASTSDGINSRAVSSKSWMTLIRNSPLTST